VKRNSDWNANSWANVRNGNAKTTSKQDDWGYTLGGPVGKPGGENNLFFFFAQEWRPRTTAGSISRFRIPTALERQGDFCGRGGGGGGGGAEGSDSEDYVDMPG
jgi:hypothetical protein